MCSLLLDDRVTTAILVATIVSVEATEDMAVALELDMAVEVDTAEVLEVA